MEASYDDRPISVYDNLSMPGTTTTTTNTTTRPATPKLKAVTPPLPPTTAAAAAPQTPPTTPAAAQPNGAASSTRSPYTEISFKFNDNNNKQQQQQQQQLQQPQLLPNGKRSFHSNQEPLHQTPLIQVHPSAAQNALTQPPYTATSPGPTTTTAMPTTASPNALRPLSQHSQSDLYEAAQSIAAVKAALHDAKSKFFGLNGYAQDCSAPPRSVGVTINEPAASPQLLPDKHDDAHKPRVQIIAPPPKPQPKYQNIPENSAIFRNQPPERPPKPTELQRLNANRESSPPPLLHPAFVEASSKMPAKALPHTNAYKQVPLNDIDVEQPSQAVYMSTTVPQNIKGSKIAGRHTPTRNSLRHSRMLVVNNRHYQGAQHPNPMNFKQPNLARWLFILQILIGFLLACLAIWIFLLAPNTPTQDNPYWSGLSLLLAGILGLVLVRYQRIKRHKVRENCFVFLRADSYLLSLLAVVLCCVALICAAIHFVRLTAPDTKCESSNILLEHGSCTCTFNAPNTTISGFDDYDIAAIIDDNEVGNHPEDHSYKVEYRDLSCGEVRQEWTLLLGLSSVLNGLGLIVSIVYIVLLACCRHNNTKRFYSSVHTSTF